MDDLLQAIQDASESLTAPATPAVNGAVESGDADSGPLGSSWNEKPVDVFAEDTGTYDEEMFDDTGDGAGVEGDLDQEED